MCAHQGRTLYTCTRQFSRMNILVLSVILAVRRVLTRECYTCSFLKLNETCPKDAQPKNVSDIYSCVLWRIRSKGEEDVEPKVLRQTYLYHTECTNLQFWKDFMKRRYEVDGEMDCCLSDLCNSIKSDEKSNTTAKAPTNVIDKVEACSKMTFVSGPETLVPTQFIAMAEDVLMAENEGEEATANDTLNRVKRDENQTDPNIQTNNSLSEETEPEYRLNSVQLIIGDKEKIFKFVTAPPTTEDISTEPANDSNLLEQAAGAVHNRVENVSSIAANQSDLIAANQSGVANQFNLIAANQSGGANQSEITAANQSGVANQSDLIAANQSGAANQFDLIAANQPGAANQTNLTAANQSEVGANQPGLTTPPPAENQTTEVLLPDIPKMLTFFLKFVNNSSNRSIVIRLMDGNLDTNQMYSVRLEQPHNGTNTTVSVYTVEDDGLGSSTTNVLFSDTLESLKLDVFTGFWLRKDNKTLELGVLDPKINNSMEEPLVSWVDSTLMIDVQYVGFTGGGDGAIIQYGCNMSQLMETVNRTETTSGLVKLVETTAKNPVLKPAEAEVAAGTG